MQSERRSKHSTDVLSTFLNTLDSKREGEAATSKEDAETRTSSLAGMMELLTQLNASGSQTIRSLVENSGLKFIELANTLESMEKESVITITGDAGHQVVNLTDSGRSLARLGRPNAS